MTCGTRSAGDFNGDQIDELVVRGQPLALFFNVFTEPCVIVQSLGGGALEDHAIGDHDGDGDDEVAVLFATGEVFILDGE